MSDHTDADGWDSTDAERPEQTAVETVEAYDVDDGVVFYDAENPLAWLEARRTFHLSDVV